MVRWLESHYVVRVLTSRQAGVERCQPITEQHASLPANQRAGEAGPGGRQAGVRDATNMNTSC